MQPILLFSPQSSSSEPSHVYSSENKLCVLALFATEIKPGSSSQAAEVKSSNPPVIFSLAASSPEVDGTGLRLLDGHRAEQSRSKSNLASMPHSIRFTCSFFQAFPAH